MKVSIKNFFNTREIQRKLGICSHLSKKFLTENFIFLSSINFWFIVEIAVTIILQNISQYHFNNGWFRITVTIMHQLNIALIKQTFG